MITLNYDYYICVKLAFSETQILSIFPVPSGKFENKMYCSTFVVLEQQLQHKCPLHGNFLPASGMMVFSTPEEISHKQQRKWQPESETKATEAQSTEAQWPCWLRTVQICEQQNAKKEGMGIWIRKAHLLYTIIGYNL